MVFKGRFFYSKKQSGTSSPEGSNSPRSIGSNSSSPIRSDKKKAKSTVKDEHQPPIVTGSSSFGQNKVKDGSNSTSVSKHHSSSKKDVVKGIEPTIRNTNQVAEKPGLGSASASAPASASASASSKSMKKGGAEVPATVSPILASSLGLNWIKTRSGPLPQESFFGFSRDSNKSNANNKMSSLGASNLSKSRNSEGGNGSNFKEGFGTDKKKMSYCLDNVGGDSSVENGSNSDMSTESLSSRDHTPNVLGRSRLHNGESSSEAECQAVPHSSPQRKSCTF